MSERGCERCHFFKSDYTQTDFCKKKKGVYNYIQIKYPVKFNNEFAVHADALLYDRHKDISHLAAFSYIGHFSKLIKHEAPEPF
jgi:hypothetical protein